MENDQCYKEETAKSMLESGVSPPFPMGHKEASSREAFDEDY